MSTAARKAPPSLLFSRVRHRAICGLATNSPSYALSLGTASRKQSANRQPGYPLLAK
jgi:hypothetical protein